MPPRGTRRRDYRPSDEFLRQIDRLDRSSPQFSDQLVSLFREKNIYFSARLNSEDRDWLIEWLDNALSALNPIDLVHWKRLDQLAEACCNAGKFPQSQILDVYSLVSIPNPTPIGPYQTCYEGLLNNSKVCVKKLKPSLARRWTTSEWSRFYYGVRWKYLRHPNIVSFLGFTNEPIQFVSALVPGESVTTYITSSPDTVDPLGLLAGIGSGLEYLHSRDVVHGDLGGPNIIVDDSGHPRITNFGLLEVFPKDAFDEVRVCKRWASPALLEGECAYLSDDIFSFAMVIVEVFTGQIPFFPVTDYMAQSAIVQGERPTRPTHPDLTDRLWALVERCWNVDDDDRPGMDEVLRSLDDCRNESAGKASQIPKEDGSNLTLAPPPVPVDWVSQIAIEILDLTDQIASVALFGPIGVGKSFIAHAALDHDRTRATFGDNYQFIRCDDLQNSPDSFIQRLSEAIHIDVTQLRSRLESSPPLMLVLDGVDSFLDPPIPEADEILGMIEEFGSYKHVCLVTTSRMYPNIRGFHRVNIPAPPESGARDMFHSLCDLDRSSTLDTLIARLDFHPLSIKLVANAVKENNWDEATLLKTWEDHTSVFKENYYQRLKDAIEPVFCSPTLEKLGDAARNMLFAIASFPSGIGEGQLGGIFRARGGVGEVVDVLCRFSLVSRRDGIVRMPSPFRLYFLESMIVIGEPGEVIEWGPDCMPKRLWRPVYPPLHPTRDSLPCATSFTTPYQNPDDPSSHQDPNHRNPPPDTDHVPPRQEGGPPCTSSRLDTSTSMRWIRRLPKIIKQRLLALFGRRIAPAILVELQADPDCVPPTSPPADPTDAPHIAPQECVRNVLSAVTQDSTLVPLTITQKDLPELPPASPQDDPADPPYPERDDDATTPPLATPQQQHWVVPEAYEV